MTARWRYYAIVALGGAVIMALEILSSRLLAPEFGNSVYVWGSIISVFLAALSLGYWLGGRLADRAPRLEVLSKLILFAAVGQAILLVFGEYMVAWLGAATGGAAWGTLVATTVLFGPLSVLLATVSPFMVRLAASDLAQVGNTAGRLYAVSTAGSLVGTLGCTFVLIPFLELDRTLALLVGVTVASAFIGLANRWREERGAVALGLALTVLAVSGVSAEVERGSGVLASKVTAYQTLEVLEYGGARYLKSDRVIQSGIRLDDGMPAVEYPRYVAAALLWTPDPRRMLVLGMGAGSVATYLGRTLDGLHADLVDVDRVVPQLAEQYFGFRADARTTIHVGDARRFLGEGTESWDIVYCDTYIGAAVPFHLATLEFFQAVKSRLAPGGVLGVNLAADLSKPFPMAIYRTVRTVFPTVEVFNVHRADNVLILATVGEAPPWSEIPARAADLDRTYDFNPTLTEIVATRRHVDLDLTETLVLRDRFAPVNWMVRLSEPSSELPIAPAASEND